MPLAASDTHTCLLAIQLAWGPGDDGTVAHACARARVHACNAWVANTVPWQPLQTRGSLSCRKEHMRLYAMQRCQVNTRERERERGDVEESQIITASVSSETRTERYCWCTGDRVLPGDRDSLRAACSHECTRPLVQSSPAARRGATYNEGTFSRALYLTLKFQ